MYAEPCIDLSPQSVFISMGGRHLSTRKSTPIARVARLWGLPYKKARRAFRCAPFFAPVVRKGFRAIERPSVLPGMSNYFNLRPGERSQ
jgi:hypothetical protein